MNGRSHDALADSDVRRTYEQELLFGEATETVGALLKSLEIPQKELAKRLGVSEGRISQILSGGENLTLRTLADLGWALGLRFDLDPVPMDREERLSTPAAGDPPAPPWVHYRRQAVVGYRHMPPLKATRRPARLVVVGVNDRNLSVAA